MRQTSCPCARRGGCSRTVKGVMSHRRLPALLLAAALVATACSGDKKPAASPSPTVASVTPSPTPSASPTKRALLSPLTGKPVDRLRPVVAAKIDNATLARPQWGLDYADVVYEEVVEGRLTRFVAMFSSREATELGPVRSVRESDIELLRMYGKVALAFSGGNRGVLAGVRASGAVFDVSYDAYPAAYTIAARRRDAYSFVTGTDRILQRAPQSATAKDVGFRFGAGNAKRAKPGRNATIVWSRNARTSWVYSPTKKVYLRSMDGRPAMLRSGRQQSAPTVIVQYVRVKGSRYSDVSGARSPYTVTTGTGNAVVLRDGKAYYGTWKRSGTGPTRFVDAGGKDMKLKTGPVWVMLVPSDLKASIS